MFADMHGHDRGIRGGGGRGRRMFDGGELRLVLLKLIADEPRHGYDLIRRIEELTGGAYAPSPGVIYPTIALLDEMGLIAARESDGAKKRFAVTDDGMAHLTDHAGQVAALTARLAALAEHHERTDSEAARRAMRNLGEVVRGKLRREELSEERRYEIVALIDEVAQKIERLK
ncbi:PadR family transcriptional regulator [Sphingomonas sp. CFBP 8760]|uniref:PadR family transcriptional regulator n=1 Tax=Sphingomonas sp. CFBP 8760 TaxID=2775282 RepID=UPI001FCE9D58|nr:PadR family transcriptional regulator [Sphingomonas sp. CFBP 8760]